jgi:hypothetical protein
MSDFDKLRTRRYWLVAFGFIVMFGIIYSGLWLALAMSSREQVVKWIEEQQAHGFSVRYDKLLATGYPLAIRFEVTNPGFGAPNNAAPWDWEGTHLNVKVQLWDRDSFFLETSGQQILVFGVAGKVQTFTGNVERARGELRLSEGSITKAEVILQGVQLTSQDTVNAAIRVPRAQMSIERLTRAQADHQAANWSLSGSTAGLSLPWLKASPLGTTVESLSLKARLIGNVKAGELVQSLEDWRDKGGTVELKKLRLRHGPLKINTDGTLALDGKLQPIGSLMAHLEGFFETIDALKNLGLVKARDAITAKMIMGVLSRTPKGGGPAVLNLAVTAQDRYLYVGPVRLLKLPEINWR